MYVDLILTLTQSHPLCYMGTTTESYDGKKDDGHGLMYIIGAAVGGSTDRRVREDAGSEGRCEEEISGGGERRWVWVVRLAKLRLKSRGKSCEIVAWVATDVYN
jgi:hypothetical protein